MAALRSNDGIGAGETRVVSQVLMRDQAVVVRWWARALEGDMARERSDVWGEARGGGVVRGEGGDGMI